MTKLCKDHSWAGEGDCPACETAFAGLTPARPAAPQGVAYAEPTYLCQAWGETDLPSAAIVRGLDAVRAFLVDQWLGDEDQEHDDGTKALPAAMAHMQEEWAQEGEAWKWSVDFEIGGVSVQRVDDVGASHGQAPAGAVDDKTAEHAMLWRQHCDKLDALVTYCPTCCQGFIAQKDISRDEVIFECGKTAGREAAKKLTAQAAPAAGAVAGAPKRILEPIEGVVHYASPPGSDCVTACGISDWIGEPDSTPTTRKLTCKSCQRLAAMFAPTPAAQAQAGAVPLTAKQMESGREAIFSTGNPYCPCDSKTFRKVAEWVERHHGIKGADHA